MAEILTSNKNYYDIANTIRQMKEVNTTYKPREMASALKDIYSNEVEGTLPLTFESNGMNLLDYRIDGASGGVGDKTSNLFNFNEWSENLTTNANNELIISNNSITITAVGDDAFTTPYYTTHPNIYKIDVLPNSQYVLSWDSNNTLLGVIYVFKNGLTGSGNYISVNNATRKYITFSTDGNTTFITVRFGVMNAGDSITYSHIQLEEGSTATDYEPYGYKVPVVISGKNLFYGTIEQGGFNATGLNADSLYRVRSVEYTPIESSKTYTLSLNVDNNNDIKIGVSYYNTNDYTTSRIGSSGWLSNPNNEFTFTTPNNASYIRFIVAYNDDSNIYPSDLSNFQLEEGPTATDYEPYHEPTTTNIYLDSPIGANESISLSDTNVDIPTIEGTNVITIDTTVQPSNVYAQARKDPDEIVYLTTILEEEI